VERPIKIKRRSLKVSSLATIPTQKPSTHHLPNFAALAGYCDVRTSPEIFALNLNQF